MENWLSAAWDFPSCVILDQNLSGEHPILGTFFNQFEQYLTFQPYVALLGF